MAHSLLSRNAVDVAILGGVFVTTTNNRGSTQQWRGIQLAAIICLALASIALTLIQRPWFWSPSIEPLSDTQQIEEAIPIIPVLLIHNKIILRRPFRSREPLIRQFQKVSLLIQLSGNELIVVS